MRRRRGRRTCRDWRSPGTIENGDLEDSGFKIGDAVCALVAGGGYAEFCVCTGRAVPAQADGRCRSPKPLDCPRRTSRCGATYSIVRAWRPASRCWCRAARAESASQRFSSQPRSAIRCTPPQVVPRNATPASHSGARRAINYKTEDFVEVIKQETGGRGVDVILDMVAGDYVPREIQSLADDGRLVFIALLGGAKATIDLNAILRRRLTVTGSTLRPRSVAFKGAIAQRLRESCGR